MAISTRTTLRRLIQEIKTWADAHPMINKFGYGDFLDLYHESEREYFYFMVNCSNASEDQWYNKYQLEIFVADWVFDERINQLRAESDTEEIIRDFTNTVRISPRWQSFCKINGDIPKRKVIERGEDKVTGWGATINIWVKRKSGFCDLTTLMPEYDFDSQSTVGCESLITGNGTLMAELTCGESLTFSIKDENGLVVGTYNSVTNEWRVPPAGGSDPIDVTVNGTIVFNQVTTDQILSILSQADLQIGFDDGAGIWRVDNSVFYIKDSSGTILYTLSLAPELSDEQSISNSTVTIKNSAGVTLHTVSVKAQDSANQTISDCTQTMNGSAITAQLPETSKSFTIRRANNDPVTVTTITDTATSFVGEVPDVINTATPWKDGQTTSYVTGDAGANEDGAGTDFFTTNFTNDFGNTSRFTSENGDQTYTAGYIVDHAKKDQATGRIRVWKIGLESAAATTHLSGQPYTYGGLSGWKIPRIGDATEIFYMEQPTTALNYAPFNINANSIANSIILQNTLNATTGYRFANSLILSTATLANTMRRICYRDCTLAEINSL